MFTGAFYLEELCPQVYGGAFYDFMKKLWDEEYISNLALTFLYGDYINSKGQVEKWKATLPESISKEYAKQNSEIIKANTEETIKRYKAKRDAAKKQLIEEGYNKGQVEELLDRCVVSKGMNKKLIQRASALNANLSIEMNCTIDGHSRQLVVIINPATLEIECYAYIGYDIWGNVSVIELPN